HLHRGGDGDQRIECRGHRKHKLHVGTGVANLDQRDLQSNAPVGRTKCDGQTGVR
ncbi:hypothetical protein D028_3650B, partial [Vibrio parahaemolyticus 50]